MTITDLKRINEAIATALIATGIPGPFRFRTGDAGVEVVPNAGWSAGQITQAQQAADAAFAAESVMTVTAVQRREAKTTIASDPVSGGKLARGIAAVLIDEINTLRQWIVAFKAEVAAASSLADLKTRVAGLPNLPDRTLAQAKTAVSNKIDGGTVD